MNNTPNQPPLHTHDESADWLLPDTKKVAAYAYRRTAIPIVIVTVVITLLVVAVGVITFFTMNSSETSAAAPTSTSTTESISPTQLTETTTVTATQTTSTAVEVTTTVTTEAANPAESQNTGGIACDGRGVLIVHSVVDYGQDIDAETQSALAKYPGARALSPGACSSLRAQVDGRTIWPIVIDYGFDTSALCAAARQLGGNPRTLNNASDFTSPC
ncbi:hypothetical protein CMUST_02455 [Corynebacterium mustelae]|uniref:Uncharacterized protein n=1 Tax=Corynebacterium mustelae TaxID=571915 RepID=A0A0G3GWC8_9CORY|nr:hypothetical protein [Corynebacterium mustelae]AKK04835.1 hypothetical protein CMUST_02455 [Corynebacterium mustelae]